MNGCLIFLLLITATLILLILCPLLGLAWVFALAIIFALWIIGLILYLVLYLVVKGSIVVGGEISKEAKEKIAGEIIKSKKPPAKWIQRVERKIAKCQEALEFEKIELAKRKGRALCISKINQLITSFRQSKKEEDLERVMELRKVRDS